MSHLGAPISIGSIALRNRLYRAPVLEGAASTPDPAATYARHFVPNARAGVGLIVQGHTTILPEGSTSPGMSRVRGRDDLLALAPMVAAVREAGARIVVQLGHGGLFALQSWHRRYRASRGAPPLSPSPPPWWLRPLLREVHVPTTAEVEALAARFGLVAAWAREAGYDGVQLAGSNAKLLHQFLSATYNRRRDRFGGGIEGRATILIEIREAIAREAGRDFPVLLKAAVREDGLAPGITLEEGLVLARLAERAGFAAITPVAVGKRPDSSLCKGTFPAEAYGNARLRRDLAEAAGGRARALGLWGAMWLSSWRHPFRPVWNREVFRAVKAAVAIPVMAVGGIRTPREAASILDGGEADLVGLGRPFYVEPELPRWFLQGGERASLCASCNRCVVAQMLGMPGVCYNPATRGRRATSLASWRESNQPSS